MTATADLILERRRTRRRLALWRILAIVAIAIAGVVALARFGGDAAGDRIARIRVDGVIFDDRERTALLARLAKTDSVKAVIVAIDSPGGTVVGSEAIFEGLRRIAETKPVVAVMGEAAASGGYITALGADYIIARRNTLTGSIGVVAEIPNVSELLDMAGIDVTRVKSAPLKAEPSLTTPPAEGAIEDQERLIADAFAWFKGVVGERRGLEGEALDAVADGRVYTGGQALDRGLIDAIGAEAEARAWLTETHGIDADMPVRDMPKENLPFGFDAERGVLGRILGVENYLRGGPRLYAVIQ